MCKSIHSCVSYKLLWHRLCKIWIDNSYIWCNLKICEWIFDTLIIVSNYGKSSNFCSSSRCRGYCAKVRLLSKLRKTKHLAHVFKCTFWVLVLNPHSLRSVNWRASTNCNNPVRLKFEHLTGTIHHCSYRWI